MYLLIQTSFEISRMPDKFTSHYVSINSTTTTNTTTNTDIFTSHYVSINSIFTHVQRHFDNNLHPTMYLLIQLCPSVSWIFLCHLHPTMYLLILTLQRQDIQVSVIYIPLCIY